MSDQDGIVACMRLNKKLTDRLNWFKDQVSPSMWPDHGLANLQKLARSIRVNGSEHTVDRILDAFVNNELPWVAPESLYDIPPGCICQGDGLMGMECTATEHARLRKQRDEARSDAAARLKQMLTQQDIDNRAIREWANAFREMKSEKIKASAALDHWRQVSGFSTPEEIVAAVDARFKSELPKGLAARLWGLEQIDRKKAEDNLAQARTDILNLLANIDVMLEADADGMALEDDDRAVVEDIRQRWAGIEPGCEKL